MKNTRLRMTPRELMDSMAIDSDVTHIAADVGDNSQEAHFEYVHFHFSRWTRSGKYKEYCKTEISCLN